MNIAWIVGPVSKLLGIGENLTKPERYVISVDKKNRKRIEASMKYVFVDEKVGEFEGISDEEQQKKKKKYRERIFDT